MDRSNKRKKAAVFDHYLDTMGGGEVYTASVVRCLLQQDFAVELFWEDTGIKHNINKFLGIDIDLASINHFGYSLFTQKGHWLQKRQLTHAFDLAFFVSDGSVPVLFSKKNILHFQIPFTNVHGSSLLNHIKLSYIHHIVCNSNFTKRVIDKEYSLKSEVLYPPININPEKTKKQNIILSVGRFTDTLHNKRQDVLVSSFKNLVDEGLKDWRLVLIGSSKEGKTMIEDLKALAKGYPIEILTDVRHTTLEDAYTVAKIFWHAAGFGVDQEKHPKQVEHFGIATAEAMAAGCIPIVINKGGQPEIVEDGKNGYLWGTTDELKTKTIQLISNPREISELSDKANKSSKRFSKERFFKELSKIIG